jgi:hypothetical protein
MLKKQKWKLFVRHAVTCCAGPQNDKNWKCTAVNKPKATATYYLDSNLNTKVHPTLKALITSCFEHVVSAVHLP